MAPPKVALRVNTGITTRTRTIHCSNPHQMETLNKGIGDKINKIIRGKRKADCSPSKDKIVKRSALGDLTNNGENNTNTDGGAKIAKTIKKLTVQSKVLPSVKTVQQKRKPNENLAPPSAPVANKITTRATSKVPTVYPSQTAVKPKEKEKGTGVVATTKKRLSNEFEKTDKEESLYSSALEEINDSTYFSAKRPVTRSSKASTGSLDDSLKDSTCSKESNSLSFVAQQLQTKLNLGAHDVPEGVTDYDKENWDDVYQVSHYAMDIFNYYREKEDFQVGDYMDKQVCLTKWMRSLLVDWMVEIQESFELNHETLYLGVKLVDMYLDRVVVSKETLQLVGAASMFVASKFDERIPPMIDDFLYICDGAYNRREMIRMEINLIKVIGFNLGIPISYRFLRRYARCGKVTMPVLTLARYILEFSLMEYETIRIKDSLLAAASLYLALRMKKVSMWTPTLEFYTGYKLDDIKNTVLLLNKSISKPAKSQIMTVKNKYSHKIFFEVAKTPVIKDEDLF
ncbi:G2/mitotic-specific cyclin-B3-like isoform X2 [Anthonomus grandis grandis]|uniref:G2/mitotic-specific cyclin-B3-like isoform X2 n=1 Tax=Anthonomus grandis grandis TaxID=2921223 RepID=UPI0021652A5C|nr:G2/mitotic-specific cyclin-B3-like isoform X2 [Anthonomus grandis grandis]